MICYGVRIKRELFVILQRRPWRVMRSGIPQRSPEIFLIVLSGGPSFSVASEQVAVKILEKERIVAGASARLFRRTSERARAGFSRELEGPQMSHTQNPALKRDVIPEPCFNNFKKADIPHLFVSGWDCPLLRTIYPGFEIVAQMGKTRGGKWVSG